MANIKGTAFIGIQRYLAQTFGPKQLEAVKAALSPEDRELLFGKQMLPITWVDWGAYTRYLLIADAILGKGDKRLILEANNASVRFESRGLYRIFFVLITPVSLARNGVKLWKQYYDKGTMSVEFAGPKKLAIKVVDVPDIPADHEYANYGYMEECWRMTGAKNVRMTHPKCMARGDDCCLFDLTWE